MDAEYRIDSTNTHVRRKNCSDVHPKALRRYTDALNAVRSALQLVRLEQGARHPTLVDDEVGRLVVRGGVASVRGVSPPLKTGHLEAASEAADRPSRLLYND